MRVRDGLKVKLRVSLRNTVRFNVKGKSRVSNIQFSFIKLSLFQIDLSLCSTGEEGEVS